jgi:hypothetical protein
LFCPTRVRATLTHTSTASAPAHRATRSHSVIRGNTLSEAGRSNCVASSKVLRKLQR